MMKDLQPEYGAVVWDEGLPQRRTELQPAYKETRKEMPQPMIPQLDFIQKLTPLLGFKNISLPNTEADDLMGCYAVAACRRGWEVVLATNDKDLFQLVNPQVKIYTTAKADLASPKDAFALLGEPEVIHEGGAGPGLLHGVEVLADHVLDQRGLHALVLRRCPDDGGDPVDARLLRRAPAPFAGDQLVAAVIQRTDDQRLEEPDGPDRPG
jgi:DNA polymerase-1